jgi:hypothetical protein
VFGQRFHRLYKPLFQPCIVEIHTGEFPRHIETFSSSHNALPNIRSLYHEFLGKGEKI